MKNEENDAVTPISPIEAAATKAAITEAGKFLASVVKGPIKGMILDELRQLRWKNQVRLVERARHFLKERGLDAPGRNVPIKVAYPIIEGALMEDDPGMQDRWARLLASAADPNMKAALSPAYASILRDLSPLDATILEKIFRRSPDRGLILGTWRLPADLAADSEKFPPALMTKGERGNDELSLTLLLAAVPSDVQLALDNLIRVGVIADATAGFRFPIWVRLTGLGHAFCEYVEGEDSAR